MLWYRAYCLLIPKIHRTNQGVVACRTRCPLHHVHCFHYIFNNDIFKDGISRSTRYKEVVLHLSIFSFSSSSIHSINSFILSHSLQDWFHYIRSTTIFQTHSFNFANYTQSFDKINKSLIANLLQF